MKKILEVYEFFKGSPLEVISQLEKVPENFSPLKFSSLEDFESKYTRIYNENCHRKTSLFSDSEENNEVFDEESLFWMKKKQKIEEIHAEKKAEAEIKTIRTEIQIFPKTEKIQRDFNEFFQIKEPNIKENQLLEEKFTVKNEIKQEMKENTANFREFITKTEAINEGFTMKNRGNNGLINDLNGFNYINNVNIINNYNNPMNYQQNSMGFMQNTPNFNRFPMQMAPFQRNFNNIPYFFNYKQ